MKISIILPVLNDESSLRETLQHLRRTSDPGSTEIIVSDGRSRDRSLAVANELADRVVRTMKPGRARQMHQGAVAASGEILLFLHADTRLPSRWRQALEKAWSLPQKPSATAFTLRFANPSRAYRLIEAAASLRTKFTGVPHGDQAIAVSRKAYFETGGFPPIPLMEEYALLKRLKERGPVRILPECVRTSPRRYEKNGKLFNSLKNGLIIILYYLGVSPHTLKRMYK